MRAVAAAMVLCVACGSKEAEVPRPTEKAAASPSSCAGLLGKWREVEPIDDTTVDEPKDDKVRPIASGSWLLFEPARLTVESATERSESRLVVERAATGTCLLHARDSKGRPMDIEASLMTERLLRLHNIAEPRSPASLFERQ